MHRQAPIHFLKAAFEPDDWIAVLLKRHDTGEAIQRVGSLDMVLAPRFQSWLRFKNAHGFSVFVSVNALTPGRRSRTRDAVSAVRHVFLDADHDADEIVVRIHRRQDLPWPSFLIRSSPGRAHVLWKVTGMSVPEVEALQKHLARQLGTDIAATSAAQLSRLPGFLNRKYAPPTLVSTNSLSRVTSYGPDTFPMPPLPSETAPHRTLQHASLPATERARRYLAATPPALQGQRGDCLTFALCCRLIRQFGLSDIELLSLLHAWNRSCQPPWSEGELAIKLRSARQRLRCRSSADRST